MVITHPQSWSRSISKVTALATMAICLAVLLGWATGVQLLTTILPGFVAMKVNTALGLLMLAASLLVRATRGDARRTLVLIGPLFAIALGALTLTEYLFPVGFSIDQLFVQELPQAEFLPPPGRMSLISALNFILLGGGAAISIVAPTRIRLWQSLVLINLFLNLIAIFGYVLGADTLIKIYPYSATALPTCIAFFLVTIGQLGLRPQEGLMAALTSPETGGQMARQLLPGSIIAFTLIGVLTKLAAGTLSFHTGFDTDLIAATGASLMIWLIWSNANRINQADIQFRNLYTKLETSENQLHLVMDSIPVLISYVDADERYRLVNAAYTKWFGERADAILGKRIVDVVGTAAYPHIRESVAAALSGKTITFEQEVPYQTAGKRYILATYVPDTSQDGVVRGFFAVINDITDRKIAEEQLREAEQRYADLYENAPDMYASVDPGTGLVINCNRTLANALGYAKSEMIGYPVFKFHQASSIGAAKKIFRNGHSADGPSEAELLLVRKDGSLLEASLRVTASRTAQGSVSYYRSIWRDISQLKAAQRALSKINEELEARVRDRTQEVELQGAIVRNMAEGACLITVSDLRIAYANPKFEAMFGYDPGELNGEPASVLDYSRDPRFARELAEQITRQCVLSYEIENVKKDGTPFWCRATASVFHDAKYGDVLVAVHEDITQRKQAELEFKRSEERFHQLIEQASDGIFIADLSGHYTEVNSAACQMLGYSPDELIGKTIADVVRPQDIPRLEHEKSILLEPGKTRISEWELVRKDGSLIETEIAAKILPDGRWTAFVRDIGERKRFETSLQEKAHELARSNEELEQFAYVASHDLREPLRMVTNYAQLLERKYKSKLDPSADRYISYMVEGVGRMEGLISDLLTYSRVGRSELAFEPTDMNTVLRDTLKSLDTSIREAGARIVSDPLPVIDANPMQMRQLLQNLLSNSIKFRRPGVAPEVHVSAERRDHQWMFTVSDNGIGIEPQYADRIFVIFQRLHSRSEYPGTGIGLAICKKIVERHRGTIWMKPRPGGGTRFCFTLPTHLELELPKASGL